MSRTRSASAAAPPPPEHTLRYRRTSSVRYTLQTLLATYTHVIEELRGSHARPAETLIREARAIAGHILVTQDSELGIPDAPEML